MAQQLPSAPSLPVLFAASIGCAFTVLDTNVVGIVLPIVAREFGARFADMQWVVGSYALCFAALLLPAGSVADRYGRKRVFLVGIALFGSASALCGLAGSVATLCGARAVQGAGAAFLLSPALAIISHSFHSGAARDRAWAIWGGIMGLTMAVSPILGGAIAGMLGWRWAFFVNVPICLALALVVALHVEESRGGRIAALDPAGIVLFALAMLGLTCGLVNGQESGWASPSALAGFAIGICGLLVFVVFELGRPHPMLDVRLLRSPRLAGAVLAMFAYASCAQVMAALLPQFLQNGFGRSPLEAGFGVLPFALAMLIFPFVGRRLGSLFAPAGWLVPGLLVVAVGNALTALGAHSGAMGWAMAGMFVLGAGGGLLNGETQKAIMSTMPRERIGMAAGLGTTARFTGILLSYAVLTGILSTVARGAMLALDPSPALADAVASGALEAAIGGLTDPARSAVLAQARIAYCEGFAVLLAAASAAALLAALTVRRLMRPEATTAPTLLEQPRS